MFVGDLGAKLAWRRAGCRALVLIVAVSAVWLSLGAPPVSASVGYLLQFGTPGSGNGQFNRPVGVAVSPSSGDVYVTDPQNDRVEKFDSSGHYLSQIGCASGACSSGSGNGQFNGPVGVAVDPSSGDLYVTDRGNERVELFDSSGNYLSQFGCASGACRSGSGNGQFFGLDSLAIDPSNDDVYVIDPGNNRVEKFRGLAPAPALACSQAPVVLIDVIASGGHVVISGAARVNLWRQLKKCGALPLKTSAYLLPEKPEHHERLQWLAQQVRDGGGEATIIHVTEIEGLSNDDIVRQFNEARAVDYGALLPALTELVARNRKRLDESFTADLEKLTRQFEEIRKIDFFDCSRAQDAQMLLKRAAGLRNAKSKSLPSLATKKFAGKIWLTRPRPEIDRVGSAWLIRNFIDPKAMFIFSTDPAKHPDAIPFDMFEAEFSHHGAIDCESRVASLFWNRHCGHH